MNYVLITIGGIPSHIKYTINTILSVEENPIIFLCTDRKIDFKHKNLNIIDLKDVSSKNIEHVKSLKIFNNTIFESNPMGKLIIKSVLFRITKKIFRY